MSAVNKAFILIAVTFALYSCAYIYRSSSVIGDERCYTLFDDGMISPKYAENLSKGYGPVWNIMNELFSIAMLSLFILVALVFNDLFEKKDNIKLTLKTREYLEQDAEAAIVTAGVPANILERNTVGLLGQSNKYIANTEHHLPEGFEKHCRFNPCYLQWDYSYSIGKLQPVAVFQFWDQPKAAAPFWGSLNIEKNMGACKIYSPKNSQKVKCDKFEQISK